MDHILYHISLLGYSWKSRKVIWRGKLKSIWIPSLCWPFDISLSSRIDSDEEVEIWVDRVDFYVGWILFFIDALILLQSLIIDFGNIGSVASTLKLFLLPIYCVELDYGFYVIVTSLWILQLSPLHNLDTDHLNISLDIYNVI